MQQQHHQPTTLMMHPGIFYYQYLILLCFFIVVMSILLYMHRLRLCPQRAHLTRVPSMTYFVKEENQNDDEMLKDYTLLWSNHNYLEPNHKAIVCPQVSGQCELFVFLKWGGVGCNFSPFTLFHFSFLLCGSFNIITHCS